MNQATAGRALQNRLSEILDLDLSKCEINLCFASLVGSPQELAVARIQFDERLLPEFQRIVGNNLSKLKARAGDHDLVLRNYDAGSKADDHEVEHLNLSEFAFVQDQINTFCPLDKCKMFDRSEDFIKGLRFYVFVVNLKNGTPPIHFFRTYTAKKELSRSSSIALTWTGGLLNRVTEPTFLMDNYVDCISRGDDLFILRASNFQRIFRFFEMVMKNAAAALQDLEEAVPIQNFSEFQQAVKGHFQMAAKLNNIAARKHLAAVTIEKLEETAKKYNLPLEFKTRGDGKREIVFDKKNKWELLRLLDDDYLDSSMTGNSYEATGKRLRRNPAATSGNGSKPNPPGATIPPTTSPKSQ